MHRAEPGDYGEALRPQFHFTARRDWINDPNGLVFYAGKYHMCFQHTPGSLEWGPNTWGHAVSTDLVHWQQVEHAIEPDDYGWIWSGSAVVDWANTSGLATGDEPPLVAIYTTGDSREGSRTPCVQSIAVSNDGGRTWPRWEGNPVVGHIRAENRDPKVIWHGATSRWVMALYLDGNDYTLLTSPDLRTWERASDLVLPGASECPDFFPLALDGDHDDVRWIFWGANGTYQVGGFDGSCFTPETEALRSHWGGNSYAGQTFSDIPAEDGRCIQITWMAGGRYPGMPFNQQMSFPVALALRSTPEGPRLHREPVREIECLYDSVRTWVDFDLRPGDDPLAGLEGELLDIELSLDPGSAEEVLLSLRGEEIGYRAGTRSVSCLGHEAPLAPEAEGIHLRVLLDRASIEVFGDHGAVSMATCFVPEPGALDLGLRAIGGEARIRKLEVRWLRSAWV